MITDGGNRNDGVVCVTENPSTLGHVGGEPWPIIADLCAELRNERVVCPKFHRRYEPPEWTSIHMEDWNHHNQNLEEKKGFLELKAVMNGSLSLFPILEIAPSSSL